MKENSTPSATRYLQYHDNRSRMHSSLNYVSPQRMNISWLNQVSIKSGEDSCAKIARVFPDIIGAEAPIDPARIKYHVRPEVSKGECCKTRGFDTSARTEMERLFVPGQ